MDTSYAPGICNIGDSEIKRRYYIGFAGVALMLAFIVLASLLDFSPLLKLLFFAPTAMAASGFLQVKHKFCFVFGFYGIYNFVKERKFLKNRDLHNLSLDRRKALNLIVQIFVLSSFITLLYYFISA